MYFHSIFNILVVASSVLRFHMRLEVWEYGNFTISHEMFSRCNAFSTFKLGFGLCIQYVFGAWRCSGMFFAKTCRHFDGLVGKKYTYSGFYLECEKKRGACVRIRRCIRLIMENRCGKERGMGK